MISRPIAIMLGCAMITACNEPAQKTKPIRVVSAEQQRLHQLDAYNLGIGLKRAIYDAGYNCRRVTDGGYVGTWKNLDQWVARCEYENGATRDWAVFAGPDGGAQVRECKDVVKSGLPPCDIKKRPAGSFVIGEDAPAGDGARQPKQSGA
ncbi:MAG TPA: hypothetical protein VIL42_04345 [Sphingomicrobium sp.]|jgi:hypothetical protein